MTACEQTRAVAAELALGIAEGDQRAAALEHLAHCRACRLELDQLADAADRVLVVAPEVEPPLGFELRVLAQLADGGPAPAADGAAVDGSRVAAAPPPAGVRRRPGRRWAIAAAVLAAVVVFGLGLAVGRAGGPSATHTVTTSELVAASGLPAGQVTAVSGERSWLVVKVGDDDGGRLAAGEYRVVCTYAGGRDYTAGTLRVADASRPAAWSTSLWYPLDDLTGVRLVAADGGEAAAAPFPPP